MNRFILALLALLLTGPAWAADNAIVLTPGIGVTERSIDVGSGVQAPGVVLVNSAGTNLIGAGTTIPISGTLSATQSGTWNIGTVGAITNPVAATQSGAWTITQGPAGAAAWLVTGTGGTFPVTQSGAWTVTVGSVTNPVAVTQSGTWNIAALTSITNPVSAAQSGTWTVQPGNTANTTAWLVTGTGGIFPSSQSGTWNITNISGTVSLPTGAATSANQPSSAAMGSTTSGQTGHLAMGAVTTGAPTYTTGQTNALSLDTAGNLRVNITSSSAGGTSSNFGATFPTSGTAVGLTNGANMVAWSATTNYGTAPAAIAVPAVNAAVTNTVAITANSSVNVSQWAATSLGAATAWGTAPTGNVPGMNVNLVACATAVCNTNGQAAMSASAPVVIAVDQSAVKGNTTQWNSVALGSPTAWGTAPTGNVVGVNANVMSGPIISHKSGTAAGLTSLVVNAAASAVSGFNCTAIAGGAAGFCIGYNGTAAPGTGALTAANVLDFCWIDTTARGCSLAHSNGTINYSTGFVVLITSATTPYTYTTGAITGAIEGDYD